MGLGGSASGASDQIRQMVNFILQEAHEKANEIRVKVRKAVVPSCVLLFFLIEFLFCVNLLREREENENQTKTGEREVYSDNAATRERPERRTDDDVIFYIILRHV